MTDKTENEARTGIDGLVTRLYAIYVADACRFIAATLLAFLAINTFFPLFVGMGAIDSKSGISKVAEQVRAELPYMGWILFLIVIVAVLSQFALRYLRDRYRDEVYIPLSNDKASLKQWRKAILCESLPFVVVFSLLHFLQQYFHISAGQLSPLLMWIVLLTCLATGGLASCMRFQHRKVFAAALPLRATLIITPIILSIVVVWFASGGTYSERIEVRMLLNSLSLLTGICSIVVFLWCAEVAWIRRVSPWHA